VLAGRPGPGPAETGIEEPEGLDGTAGEFASVGALQQFAADVRDGLGAVPKRLEPRYLYDDLGSALFGAICRLPWYRITRAEKALLVERGKTIAAACSERVRIIELGCGTGEKLQVVVDRFASCGKARGTAVHLVDVSRLALEQTARAIASAGVPVACHQSTYEEGIVGAARDRDPGEQLLFLGSNIGNSDPSAALDLLRRIRAPLVPGDCLLLGVDLVKPERVLSLAYDDPLGITAAFNKNLLVRMNRELDADFDVSSFRHLALWNARESRVEMHLASTRRQAVCIRAARAQVSFEVGETIWTESSYKYEPDEIRAMASLCGFAVSEMWIDQDARFALGLLAAA
jgi:dimethylhistidine N-methyltransferase